MNKTYLSEKALVRIKEMMSECRICPRKCGVDRLKGGKGACGCGTLPVVYTALSHKGEEPPLSEISGSGTIFFSGCGMKCVYCQNHTFSQKLSGREVAPGELADIMLELEEDGCQNINLVNPTFFISGIVESLILAFSRGLKLPIVYNTGGYDSVELIRLLEGIVDIYLPDMRYSSDDMAERYSGVTDYVKINRKAVKEMFRQTGELDVKNGKAVRGLIIRLLVLPGGVSGTERTLEFISRNIGNNACISLMSQYYPAYRACSFSEINRKITRNEYDSAVRYAEKLSLNEGWIQPYESSFDETLFGENFKPLD
jgi:putative pyruvate formate lyase activating enzyme